MKTLLQVVPWMCVLFLSRSVSYSPPKINTDSQFRVERGNMASIFNAAFYMTIERMNIPVDQASLSSPVFNMMYLRELDRLKENYTKDPEVHQVIVAKNSEDEVIGYVDIDRRNIFNKRFPTPYLSDLVVQPLWRNKGVAKSLLDYCTDVVCKVEWHEFQVHLLVETHNIKALNLYSKLLFVPLQAETGPIDDLSQIKIIPINAPAFDINEPFSYEDIFRKTNAESTTADGSEQKQLIGSSDPSLDKKAIIYLSSLLGTNLLSTYDRVLLRKQF